MDPDSPPADVRLAPPDSGGSAALWLPGQDDELPPPYIDERLVEPETREERFRGERVEAMPANPEHGDEHTEVTYVIRSHVAKGYVVSTDLLTRVDADSDFATDTCVRRSGIDPRTGSRYLEELAIEVVNEQSTAYVVERAKELTTCGVRRLIAVFVKRGEVCEWSAKEERWIPLKLDDMLRDPTLMRPLPMRSLLEAAEADNAVARALVDKRNPVIEEEKRESRRDGLRKGRAAGKAEFLLQLLDSRGLVIDDAFRDRVERCNDEAQLQQWFQRALTATHVDELLDRP